MPVGGWVLRGVADEHAVAAKAGYDAGLSFRAGVVAAIDDAATDVGLGWRDHGEHADASRGNWGLWVGLATARADGCSWPGSPLISPSPLL